MGKPRLGDGLVGLAVAGSVLGEEAEALEVVAPVVVVDAVGVVAELLDVILAEAQARAAVVEGRQA